METTHGDNQNEKVGQDGIVPAFERLRVQCSNPEVKKRATFSAGTPHSHDNTLEKTLIEGCLLTEYMISIHGVVHRDHRVAMEA